MQDHRAHLLQITEQQLLFQTQLHQLADQLTALTVSADAIQPLASELSTLTTVHHQINNSIREISAQP